VRFLVLRIPVPRLLVLRPILFNILPAANILPPRAAPALGAGPKAAREFEAQLIGTVLESLEKTFADTSRPGCDGGPGRLQLYGNQALASALAAGGGFGIAKLITEHMEASQAAHQGLTATE